MCIRDSYAAERLARILRNPGLKFPGGQPLSLQVWRTTTDEECPFDRGPPIETAEKDLCEPSSPGCSLA
eukprot:13214456-Alexandrium_andersonii.AAC.1